MTKPKQHLPAEAIAKANSPEANAKRAEARKARKDVAGLMESISWPTDPRHRAHVQNRLEEMPESYRLGYIEALKGKSLAAAVKAHCLECVCWQKLEVELCTSQACPLYRYRPYK